MLDLLLNLIVGISISVVLCSIVNRIHKDAVSVPVTIVITFVVLVIIELLKLHWSHTL